MNSRGASLVGAHLEHRYRVDALIAHGGMSTVYRGLDTRLHRPVALKVMDSQYSGDRSFIERFEREARSAASLHHPGVVAVYDQGVDRRADTDHVYLVMQLVEGGTLRDLIRERGRLSPALALSVLEPTLSALAAAHQAGMVHRDVKPENVLIGQDGAVKVADFGLVRAAASTGASSGSVILGTVAYLSPEQVTTGAADPCTDVYAAGIVLYEMLTGTPPYTGDTALSVAYRHVNDDVPAPSELVPELPPAIDDLVLRATRRDPSVRPADASVFLAELQRARAGLNLQPVEVPAPVAGQQNRPAQPTEDAGGPPTDRMEAVPARPSATATLAAGPQGTRTLSRPAPDDSEQTQNLPAVGGGTDEPGQPEPGTRGRRTRRLALAWTLAILLLAGLVGGTAWWLGSGRYETVPRVNGLPVATAQQALRGVGLDPKVTREHHDTVPEGTVVRSSPEQGSRVLHGGEVRLVVSLGKPTVPSISAGTGVGDAERLLRDAKLQPRLDDSANRYSETVPQGRVIGVDPPPGTRLTAGSPVTIIVSKGPPPVPVPDVRGMTKEEAFATLRAKGFEPYDAGAQFSPDVERNHVISTSPAPGTEVRLSDDPRVGVVVSNAVTVPNLIGGTVGDARRQASALGLRLEVRQFVQRDSSRVLGQLPLPGSKVAPGTTVAVTAFP